MKFQVYYEITRYYKAEIEAETANDAESKYWDDTYDFKEDEELGDPHYEVSEVTDKNGNSISDWNAKYENNSER